MTVRDLVSHSRRAVPALLLALAVSVLAAAPLAADWLVMTDGARIETRGPWEERGKLIVFTDSSGNLVSVRGSDVDLAASRQATLDAVEAVNTPEPPPPAPRPSRFKLTDADVGHLDPEDDGTGGEGDAGAEDDGAAAAETDPPLVAVMAWEQLESLSGDGSTIRATLENQGTDVAVGISVTVTVFDNDGVAITTAPGQLTTTGLVPGQTSEMVADFPDVFDIAAVTFDIQQRAIASRPMEEAPSTEDGEFPVEGTEDDV